MSALTLVLLEYAPDRETAELMLAAGLAAGDSLEDLRLSWERWERNYEQALLRGDVA